MLLADHSLYWFLMPKQAAAAMAVNVGSFNDPVSVRIGVCFEYLSEYFVHLSECKTQSDGVFKFNLI
jgi:hypothetical protein